MKANTHSHKIKLIFKKLFRERQAFSCLLFCMSHLYFITRFVTHRDTLCQKAQKEQSSPVCGFCSEITRKVIDLGYRERTKENDIYQANSIPYFK